MVARARRVHDFFHPVGGHVVPRLARQHQGALLAASDRGDGAAAPDGLYGRFEVRGLEQRAELGLVGEQHVHLAVDEPHQGGAVTLDHEGVGQGQGDGPTAPSRQPRRLGEGPARLVGIEEIALQIDDGRALDDAGIDVVGGQFGRRAQVSAHGPLAVGRDVDQRPGGGRAAREERRVEIDADGAHVVGEHAAELIVGHLAEVNGAASKAGDAGDGVAGRSPGGLDARRHAAVEVARPRLVDQHHRTLGQGLGREESLVGGRDHIDDGVADGGDVVAGGHTG